jgi:hypothetical protein
MMCSTACAVSAGSRDVLDLAADAVVAERDLALEAAGVGHVDARRVGRVGLELADVVQQRAGDRDVVVDAGEPCGERVHALRDRERVLEQPMDVGLVVVLGRRRVAVAPPALGVLAEDALEQRAQVRVLDRGDELAYVGLHLLRAARRAVDQVVHVERARRGLAQRADHDLRSPARVALVPAGDAHGPTDPAEVLQLGDVVPPIGDDLAGAVAERRGAGTRRRRAGARLGRADEQDHVEVLAVAESARAWERP